MFAIVVRDVTERDQLVAQIVQSQKLDSVGQLAGGIAHDFNNQLSVLLLTVDTLLESQMDGPDTQPTAREDLLSIRTGLLHSSALTRKLLLFSQNARKKLEPLAINGQIEEMWKMLNRLLGEHIDAVVDLEDDLWTIRADAVSIDQIVTNLAINSRDAMPDGGTLTIETRNVVLDAEFRKVHPGATPGRFVRIAVRDTGIGMSESTQQQIYDPFFTTKSPKLNAGLGLSVVYGAVNTQGGLITLSSTPGEGTEFDVYFPAIDDSIATNSPDELTSTSVRGGGERILLLEDEDILRKSLKKVLVLNGYNVMAYSNLEAARAANRENRFDLILSDVRLPDGRGSTLIKEALEHDEGIRAILMSGYVTTSDDPELTEFENIPFLHKPFTLSNLLDEIRRTLDEPT